MFRVIEEILGESFQRSVWRAGSHEWEYMGQYLEVFSSENNHLKTYRILYQSLKGVMSQYILGCLCGGEGQVGPCSG